MRKDNINVIERSVSVRMYNYGSEARTIEYTQPNDKSAVKASYDKRREAQVEKYLEMLKRRAIRALVIVAAILAVVMIREARIDQLCGEKAKIENDIESLNALIMEKEMHLSYQLDMNNIDEIAISRLGMKKPDDSQIIHINVKKDNGGEILVNNSNGSNGFSTFINKAKILLEYLY